MSSNPIRVRITTSSNRDCDVVDCVEEDVTFNEVDEGEMCCMTVEPGEYVVVKRAINNYVLLCGCDRRVYVDLYVMEYEPDLDNLEEWPRVNVKGKLIYTYEVFSYEQLQSIINA